VSEAGILIPEMAQDPQGYGKVLSVGDLVKDTPIEKDDILIFHTRAGMDFIQDRKVMKCLKYEEVYGIVRDEKLSKRLQPLEFKSKEQSKIIQPSKGGGIVVA